MNKRFKLCILHIGTEKTGTSTIQSFLNLNREDLSKAGLFYPTTSTRGSQWEFVAISHPTPWDTDIGKELNISNQAEKSAFRDLCLANIESQAKLVPKADVLLISSEHFHSRLTEIEMIKELKSALDPLVEKFRIIVYFRRQDELAVSFYTTRIKSGYQGSDVFLPTAGKQLLYFQYDELFDRWAKVFGADTICPGLYDAVRKQENGLLMDFCRLAEIDYKGLTIPKWKNKSLNSDGLSFVKSINYMYKDKVDLLSDIDRLHLINICSELNVGRFFPISREQAKAFHDQFAENNARLQQLAFPHIPPPIFNSDFSFYPEVAEELPAEYNDAVIQAVKIWQYSKQPLGLRSFARSVKNRLRPPKK